MEKELIAGALELIHSEFPYLLGVDDLADRLGVSKSHLIREFHRAEGIPPGKYLELVRIEAAKRFLIQQDYPVSTVAGLVGYANGNYFCKVFRRVEGLSPGEYRRTFSELLSSDKGVEKAEKKLFL